MSSGYTLLDHTCSRFKECINPQMVEALENLANRRADLCDVITVIPGRWAGLQAVVVGSNSRKRKRAARTALAIAAVHEARSLRVLIE